MTLPLRKKRPITAPNTLPATITEPSSSSRNRGSQPGWLRAARSASFFCLAASFGFSSTLAGDAPQPLPSAAKLKWQARGTIVRNSEPSSTPTTSDAAVQPASGQSDTDTAPRFQPNYATQQRQVAKPISSKSTRDKLRNSIMQVQVDKSDAFKDPFGEENRAQGKNEPEAELPAPSATEAPPAESAPLRMNKDPFPEDQIPTPPATELPAPTSPDGFPIPSLPGNESDSCATERSECAQAMQSRREQEITKIIVGVLIEGVEGQDFPCECKMPNVPFAGRHWSPTTFTWKATGTCHKPLYFEDVQLERYGHSWNPVVQPFVSAAHFFVSVPLLPYKMGLTLPNECIYTLGYYRPGDCAPYVIDPIPLSLRGALFEAAGATAFGFWFFPPGPPVVLR